MKREKLDAKAKGCVYIGSLKDELVFKLWDPANRNIVRSKDVVFFEDQMILDIKKLEKPIPNPSYDQSPIVVSNSGGETPHTKSDQGRMFSKNSK